MYTDIARLTLRECARLLQFKDVRSVRRWCENHSVTVHTDAGTKTPYVFKTEYEAARLKSVIAYLKHRYGADWKQALLAYTAGDIVAVVNIEKAGENSNRKKNVERTGTNATRFYSGLLDAISGSHT